MNTQKIIPAVSILFTIQTLVVILFKLCGNLDLSSVGYMDIESVMQPAMSERRVDIGLGGRVKRRSIYVSRWGRRSFSFLLVQKEGSPL